MTEETLHIDGINITLFKSTRAKSLNITIKPFTGVRVSVPKTISFKKAKDATADQPSIAARKTARRRNLGCGGLSSLRGLAQTMPRRCPEPIR